MLRDGCHHCGKRRGSLIGDHMPPNKHVKEGIGAMQRSLYKAYKVPYVRQVRGRQVRWVRPPAHMCSLQLPPGRAASAARPPPQRAAIEQPL